jgi:DNA-binding LacI/PurR family transcriptional regulator
METSVRPDQPLYRQVEEYLREQITSGALQSGDMLPSVKELCEQFGGINHLTVRQGIKNLAEANLVRSVQGRGSFVTASYKRVVIVLPHLEDALFIRIAQGAQEVLESRGVHAIILDSRGSETVEEDHLDNLKNLPLAGALIFPIANSNIGEQIFRLKMAKFCFVLVDRYFEDFAAPCVVVDNYQGGYAAAQHLANQGRRCVGWIGELGSSTAHLRLEGFRAALNDVGIACPRSQVQNLQLNPDAPASYKLATREAAREAVDTLIKNQPALDAIVCCNDITALSALQRLQEKGIKVPDHMAVVGFDDVPEAATSTPPLTTVRQPMLDVGRRAAEMLLARLHDKELPVENRVLPVELVVRGSG